MIVDREHNATNPLQIEINDNDVTAKLVNLQVDNKSRKLDKKPLLMVHQHSSNEVMCIHQAAI